jgi:hypothetical protein
MYSIEINTETIPIEYQDQIRLISANLSRVRSET